MLDLRQFKVLTDPSLFDGFAQSRSSLWFSLKRISFSSPARPDSLAVMSLSKLGSAATKSARSFASRTNVPISGAGAWS